MNHCAVSDPQEFGNRRDMACLNRQCLVVSASGCEHELAMMR